MCYVEIALHYVLWAQVEVIHSQHGAWRGRAGLGRALSQLTHTIYNVDTHTQQCLMISKRESIGTADSVACVVWMSRTGMTAA